MEIENALRTFLWNKRRFFINVSILDLMFEFLKKIFDVEEFSLNSQKKMSF